MLDKQLDYIVSNPSIFNFDYVSSKLPNLVTYATSLNFLNIAVNNKNTVLCFTNLREYSDHEHCVYSDNPKLDFSQLYESCKRLQESTNNRNVHPTAKIHSTAFIGNNTNIDKDVLIESNVWIGDNVMIKEGSKIRSGSKIGTHGLEIIADGSALRKVKHFNGLVIGSNNDIGCNSIIDSGVYGVTTSIGDDNVLDANVHIAHNCVIGSNNIFASGSLICGSCSIGSSNYFGPRSTVSNSLTVGDKNHISIGSVLFHNIKSQEVLIGNPARTKTIEFFKVIYNG